jgi:hypothetical protein
MASKKALQRLADDPSRSPEERAAARAALGEGSTTPTQAPAFSCDEDHPLYAEFIAGQKHRWKLFGEPPEHMKINFREWLARIAWEKRWLSEHDMAEVPYPSTQEWWRYQADFEQFLVSSEYLALKSKPVDAATV